MCPANAIPVLPGASRWSRGGCRGHRGIGLRCRCPGSTCLPARCLASPPYLGLNKPSPDPAPGATPAPMAPALPESHAPPCPPPCWAAGEHPGHESLGVKSPPKADPRLPLLWLCHSPRGLCAWGRLGQVERPAGAPKAGHRLAPSPLPPWGTPKTSQHKMGPTGGGSPCPARDVPVTYPCPWRGGSWQPRCLRCQAPQSGVQSPPAPLAAWLLSPPDKLYNTSVPLKRGQTSIRRGGLWGPNISHLWAASGCLCQGGGQGRGWGM